jgi:4-amino-4-deoxy-L-arabinose transferase-like glycosyltransferase
VHLIKGLSNRQAVIILFLVAAVLLWAGLGRAPVYILDEAKNAQAAREMMERHDWIVPTFNAELRPHKPPLHYYFMWAAYRMFGVNAASARFFSALMGWLTIFSTWAFAKRFINAGTAFWAAVALTCSTHFLFEFHLAVPDPYLIFFITAGLFTFYAFIRENRFYWLLLSAISLGLASLAKGPVALALPSLAALIWLLFQRRWKQLFSPKWLVYAAVVALVAVPWYVVVHRATNGAFTRGFFLEHNINRFEKPMEGHGGLFILVPLFVLIGLLPLSVFTGEAVKKWRVYASTELATLSACVVTVFVVFFAVSGTKLPNYPMPCYPFAAVLLGFWIDKSIRETSRGKSYPFILLTVLNTILLIGAFIGLGIEPAVKDISYWALVLLVPVLASAFSLYQYKKAGLQTALTGLVAGYIVFNALFMMVAYPAIYRRNPIAKTRHLLPVAEPAYAYKEYNPAYNFYLQRPVIVLSTPAAVRQVLLAHPDALILSRENYLEELNGLPVKVLARERDLFEYPVTVVLSRSQQ